MKFLVMIIEDWDQFLGPMKEVVKSFSELTLIDQEVCVTEEDIAKIKEKIKEAKPNIILLDHELGEQREAGLEIAKFTAKESPYTVIISTTRPDHHGFFSAQRIYKDVHQVRLFCGKDEELLKQSLAQIIVLKFGLIRHKPLAIVSAQPVAGALKKFTKFVQGIELETMLHEDVTPDIDLSGFDLVIISDYDNSPGEKGKESVAKITQAIYQQGLTGRIKVVYGGWDKVESHTWDPCYQIQFIPPDMVQWRKLFFA